MVRHRIVGAQGAERVVGEAVGEGGGIVEHPLILPTKLYTCPEVCWDASVSDAERFRVDGRDLARGARAGAAGRGSTRPRPTAEHFEAGRAWQRELFDGGWAGVAWPREYGGRGGTPERGRDLRPGAGAVRRERGLRRLDDRDGRPRSAPLRHDAEQRARYLRPLLRADETWCQLFSEPGAGSDLANLATRAGPRR